MPSGQAENLTKTIIGRHHGERRLDSGTRRFRRRTTPGLIEGQGGATDAAIAALESKAAVIEGLGLQGAGAHSNDAEYVLLNSLEPRLYLLSRLVMDVATARN